MKYLLLIAILFLIWFAFKLLGRLYSAKSFSHSTKEQPKHSEEVSPCQTCGIYVPENHKTCDHHECPYPS